MALLPVAEALRRVLDGAAPLPAERCRSPTPTAACSPRISRRGAPSRRRTSPPWTAMRCAPPTSRAVPATLKRDRRSRGRPAVRRQRRPRRGRAHLHRRRAAAGRRHGRDPGEHRARRRHGRRDVSDRRAGKNVRGAGLDFAQGDVLPGEGPPPDRPRRGARRRDEPPGRAGASPRRRSRWWRPATNWCRPAPSPARRRSSTPTSSRSMALARREGAEVIDLGIVPDRLEETDRGVRARARGGADVLVTAGGASVGDYDLVQPALAAEGLALSFWKVAVRPGKPLMHGRLGGMQVLGLPGNPVSAYRLRGAVPGAADPPARRPRRRGASRANRRCSAATCRRTTSAPITCARRCRAGGRHAGRDAVPGAGLLDAGAARRRRLPRDSRAVRAGREGRQRLARSLSLSPRFSDRSTCSPQIKGLRNTYRTYSVRS